VLKIIILFFSCCFLYCTSTFAQTIGGSAAYSFLKQPATASLASIGGINTSQISNDVGLAYNNPSLLRSNMHQQVNVNFNRFFAGIYQYSLATAFHHQKSNLTHAFGIHFFNYGSIQATDAVGNVYGNFTPSDYAIQYSIAKQYKEKWHLGFTAKWINSNYFIYKSQALAADIGVAFYDSSQQLQCSFLVKNIGTQLNKYAINASQEELPFDVQIGISKKLANAPIQFSLTAHQLQQLNINYQDTIFNNDNLIENKRFSFADKLFSHLVAAVQVYLKEKIELNIGYNFLQRKELSNINISNGLSGFSGGINIRLKKIHIQYATGFYQQNNFNQVGLVFNWNGNPIN